MRARAGVVAGAVLAWRRGAPCGAAQGGAPGGGPVAGGVPGGHGADRPSDPGLDPRGHGLWPRSGADCSGLVTTPV